ncbi:ABC transporter substrate-binding protein [Rhodoferax sp. WC2427]|uniref:ABC transporter substrate-binding protein n=1 Tax=Rhodoferax sp. WC2427 TaxID=3234144 RepID=UPI003464F298
MTLRPWWGALLVSLLLGCTPDKPIRIGFIGGLSDRASDTGEAGRNGMALAVEQRNQAGGIHGRRIEIVVQDDAQDPAKALAAIHALVAAQVDAVVGPFTSSVAAVVVPVLNQARLTTISPTVTSGDFVGQDDYFIRVNRTTRDNAIDYARLLYQRGQRRVAAAYDARNASYSDSWRKEFRAAFTAQGGQLVAEVAFASQADTGFGDIVEKMLAAQPDGLLFIASAIDVGRLAQQAEKRAPHMPASASEWAASESLIELGGQAVEDLLIAQSYNRDDTSARYLGFHKAYLARFAREPGFSTIAAYDATTVLLQAMERQERGESVQQAILKYGPFQGLQQSIQFDRYGDTPRKVYFTEVHGGQFVLLK